MSSESIWYELKTDIVKYLDDELGNESEFESLKITTAESVLLRDLRDWEALTREKGSPLLTVQSLRGAFNSAEHGRTPIPIAQEYTFLIASVVADSPSKVEENTNILMERIVAALMAKPGYGFAITVDSASRSFFIDIRETSIYFWKEQSASSDDYFGMNVLEVRLHS